jgi:DNA-binding transcriptional LysR family regulator
MDRLEAMRIFVAVAEAEGFAPAARSLSLSPPVVTRAIAGLEERIGARLFRRTTRVVKLTEAGARYLGDVRRILAELEVAEAEAQGLHDEPRGELRVTASMTFGRSFVAPIVVEYLKRYPGVSVRTYFVDGVVDLVEEGIDVAVRIAELPDSALTAARVGSVRRVLCASPAYLTARGTPQAPSDLAVHDGIVLATSGSVQPWTFRVGSKSVSTLPRVRFVANTADVAIAAAVSGEGITRVLSYMVEPEVKAGRLRILLPKFGPPSVPIHVVHAEGRKPPAKVRAFVDLAVARLRAKRIA